MIKLALVDKLLGRRVDPTVTNVIALYPGVGPRKGDKVLIEGDIHRITYVRLKWEGPRWTIRSLRVKRDR